MTGKLIVIDGGDGAGKATQTKLLVERLRTEGMRVETLDFPRYTENTFGGLLRECLNGERGDFLQIDARIASTLYAADRFESKPMLEKWLHEGALVVLDRYVSSNMLHQGAKLANPAEVETFLAWLDHVEHTIFGLPRPDLIIYLDVPFAVRSSLKQQAINEGKHTSILDVAERDVAHQQLIETHARTVVARMQTWEHISCVTETDTLRTPDSIHENIYTALRARVAL